MAEARPDSLPAPTLVEQLTDQFYRWERRGRGWQVWPWAVPLEPPFRPFLGHYLPVVRRPVDDARKPTLLSTLTERLFGRTEPPAHWREDEPDVEEEPEPDLFEDEGELV